MSYHSNHTNTTGILPPVASDQLANLQLELVSNEAIYEEVHGRVDHESKLRDGGDGQPKVPIVVVQVVDQSVENPGCVTHQEDPNNHKQNLGGFWILVVVVIETFQTCRVFVDFPEDRAVQIKE